MSKKKDNEVKQISINTLDKLYEGIKKPETSEFDTGLQIKNEVNEDGSPKTVKITVKRIIGYQESVDFTNSVVNEVLQQDHCTFALKDFAFKYYILEYFTNLKLKKNASENHEIIYNSDLYNDLCKLIDKTQFEELKEAVDRQIEYRGKELIATKRNYSEIEQLVITLLNKASTIMDSLDIKEIMKVITELNKNGEKITSNSVTNAFLDTLYPKKSEVKEDNVVPIESKEDTVKSDNSETPIEP